ncbi:MAG: methylenetetrahydrofolate reductase [NAD(P)H] [Halofilum sp. (in: g-proteobacteria)]
MKVSFEFFPPRTEAMKTRLWDAIIALEPLRPEFVSVTCGAGGSTRERTHATVRRILHETDLTPAAHLTCVGASCAEIEAVAGRYWDNGVRHLVALRGDLPDGDPAHALRPDGYSCAAELIPGLLRVGEFDISVAGYPEVHPDAASADADVEYLKRKVDAGANRVITQFCFDDDTILRFRDRAVAAGVDVPIVPGILPVADFPGVARFARSCGATIPDWLERLFASLEHDPREHDMVAAAVASDQCRRLLAEGFDQFHFYTMNRAPLTRAVCRMIGILPDERARSGQARRNHVA